MLPALGFGLGMLGAGAGLHALGLGHLLEPLDYPRQAVWNLVRSTGNAMAGEGTWDDALRAVPGTLGAGLGAGLIASGVGAPAGILMGSLAGGLAQGLGKAGDEYKFDAPEVSDLTGTEDLIPNLIMGTLTDPLTYAGGFAGREGGKKASAMLDQLGSSHGTPARPHIENPLNVLDKTGYRSPNLDRDYYADVDKLYGYAAERRPEVAYLGMEATPQSWGGGKQPPANWVEKGLDPATGEAAGSKSQYMARSLKRLGAPDIRWPGTYTLPNGEIINAGKQAKLVPTWRRDPNGAVQNLLADQWSDASTYTMPNIEEIAFSVKPDTLIYPTAGQGDHTDKVLIPLIKNLEEAQFAKWLRDTAGRAELQTPDYQLFRKEISMPGQTVMPPGPPPLPTPNLNMADQPLWVKNLADRYLPSGLESMPAQEASAMLRALQGELHPKSFETLASAVYPGFDPAMLNPAGSMEPLLVRPPVYNWVPRNA
jgi:hypothetical protein